MYSFDDLTDNLDKDYSGLKKIKLAILSDSASQFLNTAIKGYGFAKGIDFEIYEADYNQIDHQVYDPASELYTFNPDFVFINKTGEKLQKIFYKGDMTFRSNYPDFLLQTYEHYHAKITSRLKAKVIINNYPEINDYVFGNFGAKVGTSFIYQLRKANYKIMEWAQGVKDLFVFDLAALQSQLGYGFVFDPKIYVAADMVYSLDFLPYVGKHITDIVLSSTGRFNKCLILDLDNTTWGGIIGDDGLEGIQIGDLGIGKVFSDLQAWAKELKHRGIILVVCSKNTDEVAREPFLSHPDMVLRMDDIALFVANWETKVDNIKFIQSTLNIGFDSMVFVDDNPFEREMVRSALPEVTIPDLPEDPARYLAYLKSLNLFETATVTEEDAQRTQQYQEEAKRTILARSYENEEDFLSSLGMRSEARPFDDFSIPRVSQLTLRSNQFNLRTIRYSEEDIKTIVASPDYHTFSLTLEDRFGAHGLIGVVILKQEDPTSLFIDTWIMSCRVLKRGMEQFTMNAIMQKAKECNVKKVVGTYIPTAKNGIVKDHYARLGFAFEDGRWVIDVDTYKELKTYITAKN